VEKRSPGRYGSLPATAAHLNVTEKGLRKLVERRAIPFRKRGNRLIFDLQEIDAWVRSLPGVSLDEALTRQGGSHG
jgi:hypothetical protein